jgi:uncharacterized protein
MWRVAEVSEQRRAEYERAVRRVAKWAADRDDVVGVAVVGSWARGQPRTDSDVDVVVLTGDPAGYLDGEEWVVAATGEAAPMVRRQAWGVLHERRLRLRSGLDIEFGFVPPSWASTEPVDPGTREVVENGFHPAHDPCRPAPRPRRRDRLNHPSAQGTAEPSHPASTNGRVAPLARHEDRACSSAAGRLPAAIRWGGAAGHAL